VADDDILQVIEAQSLASQQRTRELLLENGRPDLVAELDRKLKDIRTGVDGAQRTWHSLSGAQRRVLEELRTGRALSRSPGTKHRYDAIGMPHAISRVCSLATARALCARELLHVDGGATDPERKIILTERGLFVLAHGAPSNLEPEQEE